MSLKSFKIQWYCLAYKTKVIITSPFGKSLFNTARAANDLLLVLLHYNWLKLIRISYITTIFVATFFDIYLMPCNLLRCCCEDDVYVCIGWKIAVLVLVSGKLTWIRASTVYWVAHVRYIKFSFWISSTAWLLKRRWIYPPTLLKLLAEILNFRLWIVILNNFSSNLSGQWHWKH